MVPWIGYSDDSNWNDNSGSIDIPNREPDAPETSVYGITPPDKQPRNPFNGASVFNVANDPTTGNIMAGAIRCAGVDETEGGADATFVYYAFLFLGTDFHRGR